MAYAFDVMAPVYIREDEHWGSDLDLLKEAFRRVLEPHVATRYLDVGCGPGFHLANVRRLYPESSVHVAGIDTSAAMLGCAREELQRFGLSDTVKLSEIDILEPRELGNYSREVISFLNNGLGNLFGDGGENLSLLRWRAIGNIRRLLSAKGRVVISVYNLERLDPKHYGTNLRISSCMTDIEHGEIFVEYRMASGNWAHTTYSHWFTQYELRQLLEWNGFKIELLEQRRARIVAIAWAE